MSAEPDQAPEPAFQKSIRVYLQAGYPILYAVTPEEERAIELIGQVAAGLGKPKRKVFVWSVSRGLCDQNMKQIDGKTADPKRILPYLLESRETGVFILEDFHAFLDERSPIAPLVTRQLRDLVRPFSQQGKTLVVLSPVLKIPPELEKDVTVVDLDMPGEAELAAVLDETVEQVKDKPRVDVNLDGMIDGSDLAIVGRRFGRLNRRTSPLVGVLEPAPPPPPSTIGIAQTGQSGEIVELAVLVNV